MDCFATLAMTGSAVSPPTRWPIPFAPKCRGGYGFLVAPLSPGRRADRSIPFKHASSPRRAMRPSYAKNFRPEGVGNAGRPVHPQPRVRMVVVNAHEYSQRVHRNHAGIPARNGFNGFLRALPGDRACLSPSPPRSLLLKNLTPASRRQDHTTSSSASRALVVSTACVHRIPLQRP